MNEYNLNMPDYCLPLVGIPLPTKIYRLCDTVPISNWDLLSHVERKDARADPSDCTHWGLSVWTSVEDVKHAFGLFKSFKKKPIYAAVVTPDQGCLKHTPKNRQKNHHTFWRRHDKDVFSLFSISLDVVV